MKSEKFTRQIQTQKGAREGIQSLTINCPESDQEWQEAAAQADDVRLHLRQIIDSAGERLEGLPGAHEAYQLTPDGGWVSVEVDVAQGKTGFNWQRGYSSGAEQLGTGPSLPIEHASPQEFAWFARDAAMAALQAMDDGDMIQAVSSAMDAVGNWHRMEFGEFWEPAVARERGAARGRDAGGGKRKAWAEELVRSIQEEYPGKSFKRAMSLASLPVGNAGDEDPEYAGYRVWREAQSNDDKTLIRASNELSGDEDSLKMGTFRRMYFDKVKPRT